MITVAWYFTDENVIHVLYIYSTYYFTDLPLCIEGMELSNLTTNFIVHTGTFLCACLDSYTYTAIFFNKWIAFSWFVNPSNSVFSNCLRLSADISTNLQCHEFTSVYRHNTILQYAKLVLDNPKWLSRTSYLKSKPKMFMG